MTVKILINDLKTNKLMNLFLILFILLPAMMAGTAVSLILQTTGAVDNLFRLARVPDYVQMHAGELDPLQVENWARGNPLVQDHQIVEMVNLEGSDILLGDEMESLAGSVMDLGFVTRNEGFDFLLDLQNRVIPLREGEVAVPLYFMEKLDLKEGDPLVIRKDSYEQEFRIAAFLRDAQMNPALVHSKRFLMNPRDFDELERWIGVSEYLIEFLLHHPGDAEKFERSYGQSGLPGNGPAVSKGIFRLLNALTGGITIALLILLTLLFSAIALLCLRFSLLANMEEEHRNISIMKAIGIPLSYLRNLYLAKYAVLAGFSSLGGFGLSRILSRKLGEKVSLYLGGTGAAGSWGFVTFAGPGIVFLTVLIFCLVTLRRFKRISAVAGLRGDGTGEKPGRTGTMKIGGSPYLGINTLLGIRDILLRHRFYRILITVYIAASFILLVPVNLFQTISSPSFVRYMGIGECDIRIDFRQGDSRGLGIEEVTEALASDPEVSRYAVMKTSRYQVRNPQGEMQNLIVETGDFTTFPLEYQQGSAPDEAGEIALSLMNARSLQAEPGRELRIYSERGSRIMRVSGIYQDVTNGGYTAKAFDPPESDLVLWHIVNLSLRNPETGMAKAEEFRQLFSPARVSLLEDYVSRTLGSIVDQLKRMALAAVFSSILITGIITAMFLKLLILKDSGNIAIMRTLGFSSSHIRWQYLIRVTVLCAAGFLLGTLAANTAGELLTGLVWSLLGASAIRFEIDPLISSFLLPLSMILSVLGAAGLSTVKINHKTISAMNAG